MTDPWKTRSYIPSHFSSILNERRFKTKHRISEAIGLYQKRIDHDRLHTLAFWIVEFTTTATANILSEKRAKWYKLGSSSLPVRWNVFLAGGSIWYSTARRIEKQWSPLGTVFAASWLRKVLCFFRIRALSSVDCSIALNFLTIRALS